MRLYYLYDLQMGPRAFVTLDKYDRVMRLFQA